MTRHLLLGMAELAGRAESHGLTVFEIKYSERVYGSWMFTFGSAQKRLQFGWEGKEPYLTAEISSFNDINDPPNWKVIQNSIGGSNTTLPQIIEFAWGIALEQFAL